MFRKTLFLLLLCLFLLLACACGAWASFRTSDNKVKKRFAKYGLLAEIHYETYLGYTLRHIHSQEFNPDLPTLFFIHGAPGASDNFDVYLTDSILNKHANLISFDRLGYGYSEFGFSYPKIELQAQSLLPIIKKYHNPSLPSLLIGWSYGGPIAAKMSLEGAAFCDGVMLLAPALDPEAERYFKVGRLAEYNLTKWMVPQSFIVAQKEKRAHAASLKRLVDDWGKMEVPVWMLHGTRDKIVPFQPNVAFAKEHFKKASFEFIEVSAAGHLFPMRQEQMVIELILAKLRTLKKE